MRAAGLALVGLLALASCSSGDGDATARTTTTVADRATTSSSSPVPTFTGDAASPFCDLLRQIDPTTVLAGSPDDPAALEAGLRRLVGILRDAHALAPPEIEPDVALVSQGIEALDATLAAVGYDYEALAASGESAAVSEAVNDPAFATAGTRLSAYRTQVCKL